MVKMSEIKGLMVDKKEPISEWEDMWARGIVHGFNDALEQQGNLEITINREKLAAILFNFTYSYEYGSHYEDSMEWNESIPEEVREKYHQRADAIISNLKDIVEVKGEK